MEHILDSKMLVYLLDSSKAEILGMNGTTKAPEKIILNYLFGDHSM